VFFLVVSAASPITSLLGAVPLGFVSGNGPGLPAAFAVVTVVLICFAVGYAAISRRVINTGAYYTYIAQGIGRPPAIGAALLAVTAYTVNLAGIAGGSGYFVHVIAADLGADVSWIWGAVPLLLLVGLVGYRSVHVSAKLMGTIMVLGVMALLVYDVAILTSKGLAALPLESFSPQAALSHSPGLAIAIALTCFVGVDTAALYSEETDQPERTVPRATYIGVVAMGVFYVFSIWLIVGSIGADQIVAKATENPGELIFNDILAIGGEGLQTVTALLFVAASFAGILAFHNAASRYLFVLGRDRVLSPRLGHLHRRHHSPSRASLVVSGAAGLLILVAIAFRLDPYVVLAQGALGLATLGIVTLQALAAVAIVAFFRRRGHGRYWKTLVLPGVGAAGLFGIATFLLFNFDDLLGISNPLVNGLPWVIVVVVLTGVVVGLYLRRERPARYARLAESRLRPQARQLARPAAWTRRYALIGAGPAGLVMGRRLAEEGVPFDWFEAGSDVGGIWHADRPGSPVYESMAAVTSRYVSGFPDFPMPADFPDYPQWWQVRDYLRQYADYHGLYERISFGVAVTWAKPEGLGWSVTLTSGRFRFYSGIIAAPGASWFPSVPRLPGQERFRGHLWHSASYKSPEELAGRRVLVVGAGNSAADIASDAARAGAACFLSVRHGRRLRPRYIRGVPTDALLAGALQPEDESPSAEPRDLIAAAVGDVRALGLPLPDTVHSGHPTISDDLLHLLAQGHIQARGEVVEVVPDGVRFADGTVEQVDLIIACTGYGLQLPFLAPELYTRDGAPDLFMNIFSRTYEDLALLGLSNLGGPTFPILEDQARAVMVAITARELGGSAWRAWRSALSTRPDLRGGARFTDTPANALTVDDHMYSTRLRDLCDRFGYTPGGAWAGNPVATRPETGMGAALRASMR
jgi:cation diffusion facilitator CzcD-associated flavoprotein CzcO/amino acid transporter